MKVFLKTLRIIIVSLLLIILAYSGYNLVCHNILKQQYPLIFNANFSVVISNSMQPSLNIGDIVIVKKTDDYTLNDIVVFNGEVGTTTHRVHEITVDGLYITKGDNNNSPDDMELEKSDIFGEVVYIIPKIGYVILFLKSIPGIIFLILLFAYYLFFPQIAQKIMKESKENSEQENQNNKNIKVKKHSKLDENSKFSAKEIQETATQPQQQNNKNITDTPANNEQTQQTSSIKAPDDVSQNSTSTTDNNSVN